MTDKEYQHALGLIEKGIRADEREKTIEEYKEKSFDAIGIILSKTHLELNTQLTIYAKIMNEMNKIEEQLKER